MARILTNQQNHVNNVFKKSTPALVFIYTIFSTISLVNTNVISIYMNIFVICYMLSVICYLYILKRRKKYIFWHGYHLFIAIIIFIIIIFLNYAFYWYDQSPQLAFTLFGLQVGAIALGFIVGLMRFDREHQAFELRKGIKLLHRKHHTLQKGVVYLKKQAGNFATYKKRFNSWLLEICFRIVQYGYITFLSIFLIVGGGSAGLAIIRIVELYIPEGSNLSSHHMTFYSMSLIMLPVISYYIPSMLGAIRWWKDLEADIKARYGKVTYVWPGDEKENDEKYVNYTSKI